MPIQTYVQCEHVTLMGGIIRPFVDGRFRPLPCYGGGLVSPRSIQGLYTFKRRL
jgi:hypothetical protein